MTRLRFLVAGRGEPFLAELVQLIADTAGDLGVASELVMDRYPEPEPECVYVTVPHEFFELAPEHGNPRPEQLQRTIALCVEPPGDLMFHVAAHYARQLGAVMHTYRGGREELQRMGINSEHFQLGYSARWDGWRVVGEPRAVEETRAVGEPRAVEETRAVGEPRAVEKPRAVDALHIGARDAWRGESIAGWAPALWRRHCRFVLPQTLSEPSSQLDGLLPEGRLVALRSARVLLNLHSRDRTHFEWPLALAAIANGCVVVSERSLEAEPLQNGVHYLSGPAEQLGQLAVELLEDELRLRDMRERAHDLVRGELPLARSVERLLDLAATLLARPLGQSWPLSPSPPISTTEPPVESAFDPQARAIAGSLARLSRGTLDTRRRLERIEHRMISRDAPDEPLLAYESDTFATAQPSVSVIVSLYNYEHEIRECLASVAASEFLEYELLVLDDASNDRSASVAQELLEDRPQIPALLLRHPVNQGLARTRNDMISRARGEFVFVLDADNLIFPSALQRLVDALQSDPKASFAYPMQVAYRDWRFAEILNAWPWDPRRLTQANYIDAMALIRREVLQEHGGYTEDPRICNCEDHDLWCQLADRGQYGVLVAQPLAVYRVQAHSQLRTIGGSESAPTLSLIRSRAPGLMRRLLEQDGTTA